ncbi:MAG: ATP-binding cassette domain-containing protein, partial [Spirochaetales bacterium]|nr:ATP-binding cassette domain-containing protein [Spirochaetales bacterium]
MIEIRNVRVRYPESDRDVVSDWTLRFNAGDIVVLFGPNGSGKTTGLKAIAGILRPETIESTVGCEAFAYVHQDPLMFHRRVHANIAYGLSGTSLARSEVAGRVRVAARRCNVEDILSRRATQL